MAAAVVLYFFSEIRRQRRKKMCSVRWQDKITLLLPVLPSVLWTTKFASNLCSFFSCPLRLAVNDRYSLDIFVFPTFLMILDYNRSVTMSSTLCTYSATVSNKSDSDVISNPDHGAVDRRDGCMWLQWRPPYIDTFAVPRGCHCKRAYLYQRVH